MKGCDIMNNNFLVPTGNIIKEYLEEYGITQKDLAERINSSEKHISNVLKGKNRLTEELALKLEKVIVGVPASYWLNYEAKYREQVAREEEIATVNEWNLQEIAKRFHFREVFKGLDISLTEQAIEMLKLLKISDFKNFDNVYSKVAVDFMEDGGEKEALAIWLNMCELEIEIQNDEIDDVHYKEASVKENLKKFKLLSNNSKTESSINSCRKLCNKLGIYLVFCEAVTNSKVRGALTTYKNHPAIYISGRFKSHSNTWFALIHEIAHLLLHYDKNYVIVTYEDDENDKEMEANEFARDFFIDPMEYKKFCDRNEIAAETIKKLAKDQGTIPEIVVARLQHDKKIGFEQFRYLH
ncbi:MAG: helix-turn-helix domain-containing protein [Lachnotalea sp.]